MQSIERILLHLSCSTSRLRSTLWNVDHEILLKRLRVTFGDNLLHGFSVISMDARSTFVVAANVLLLPTSSVVCHKDRSSDRSFSLFIPLIWRRSLLNTDCRYTNMPNADDSQGYGSCQSDARSTLSSDITECVDDMYRWMRSNRLQLNGEKTEVM